MEEFLKRLNDYLESKIPEVPKSTRDEIVAFLVYRFAIHENDALEKNNREWKKMLLSNRIDRMKRDIFETSMYQRPKGESDEQI